MVLLLPQANFENSEITLLQLLLGLVFRSSSKIFDAQLTKVPAAKVEAKQTRYNSQAGGFIGL